MSQKHIFTSEQKLILPILMVWAWNSKLITGKIFNKLLGLFGDIARFSHDLNNPTTYKISRSYYNDEEQKSLQIIRQLYMKNHKYHK